MSDFIHFFADYVLQLVGELGYLGIFFLMTIESSFLPFPSEAILIPAGVLIKTGEMNAFYALLAATSGSLLGALINYFLAYKLGRAAILRYGRFFFIDQKKFNLVERKVLQHGKFMTFFGRLIFGVRQLISIPAGLVRMNLLPFCLLTAAGAAIWSAILLSFGYILGNSADTVEMAKQVAVWFLVVIIIISVAYFFWQKPKKLN